MLGCGFCREKAEATLPLETGTLCCALRETSILTPSGLEEQTSRSETDRSGKAEKSGLRLAAKAVLPSLLCPGASPLPEDTFWILPPMGALSSPQACLATRLQVMSWAVGWSHGLDAILTPCSLDGWVSYSHGVGHLIQG